MVLGLPLLLLLVVPLGVLLASLSPHSLFALLGGPLTSQALRLSLMTSLASTGLVILFGTPLAFLLARKKFRGRGALEGLLQIATLTPPTVVGLGLLLALGAGLRFTPVAVILAQCFVACPYFIRSAAASLATIDPGLRRVVEFEGAGSWSLFRHVFLPLTWPGFLAGAVLAWARALGEFGATLIFAGNLPGRTQTLPLAIYFNFETGLDRAVVLAALLLLISLLLLVIGKLLTHGCGQRYP